MDATVPQAQVSRAALLHNVALLRRHLPDGVRLCAVLKADAYGHGASVVADALTNFSSGPLEGPAVDMLAVAGLEEAEALGPPEIPLLILRPIESIFLTSQRTAIENALRLGWSLTLTSASAANDLARIAASIGRRASVHLMLDTGIHREGAPLKSLPWLVSAVTSHPSLRLAGLATHFTSADEIDNPATALQLARFQSATDRFVEEHPHLLRHAANSAALFFTPDSHLDMVRPGLSLFGLDPTGSPSLDRPLRPVLKWTAPLLHIRDIRAGHSVGYSQSWRAPKDSRIGLVPIGYADGYPRSLSNKGIMMLHNRPAPVVGRVSMDYVTLDLTSHPECSIGDTVTVLDSDPLSPASAYRLSALADTIPHELLTRIGPRIPRIAVDPADSSLQPLPLPKLTGTLRLT